MTDLELAREVEDALAPQAHFWLDTRVGPRESLCRASPVRANAVGVWDLRNDRDLCDECSERRYGATRAAFRKGAP